MRAVDTNVVVRLVVRDDPEQVRAAEQFTSSGAWVSHLVLAEAAWVLDAVYERSAGQIATAIDMLLNHRDVTLQDPTWARRSSTSGSVLRLAFLTVWYSRLPVKRGTCRSAHLIGTLPGSSVQSVL